MKVLNDSTMTQYAKKKTEDLVAEKPSKKLVTPSFLCRDESAHSEVIEAGAKPQFWPMSLRL